MRVFPLLKNCEKSSKIHFRYLLDTFLHLFLKNKKYDIIYMGGFMSKISNVLTMLQLLQSGRKYSINELSTELEVSERMIRLYKEDT